MKSLFGLFFALMLVVAFGGLCMCLWSLAVTVFEAVLEANQWIREWRYRHPRKEKKAGRGCKTCGCASPVDTALHHHERDMLLRECLDWIDTDGGDTSVEHRVKRARLIERIVEDLNIPVDNPSGYQNPASDPGLRT